MTVIGLQLRSRDLIWDALELAAMIRHSFAVISVPFRLNSIMGIL